MKYAIVPQEPDDSMQISAAVAAGDTAARGFIYGIYRAALTARPPLDAEMQKALELARIVSRSVYGGEKVTLAIALLRANGEDV